MKIIKTIGLACILLASTACTETAERVSRIGKVPELEEVRNPHEEASYKEMTWPTPSEPENTTHAPTLLWQAGAKAFFKDQRATKVGDILRVKITIDDKAQLDNETKRDRTTDENVGMPAFFGLERDVSGLLRHNPDPANLAEVTSGSKNEGKGTIDRKEKIETELAATVTQLLPNGNLVIQGKQEIRVNAEVRQVGIAGVVRPEDIASDTINHSRLLKQESATAAAAL